MWKMRSHFFFCRERVGGLVSSSRAEGAAARSLRALEAGDFLLQLAVLRTFLLLNHDEKSQHPRLYGLPTPLPLRKEERRKGKGRRKRGEKR